MEVENDCIWKGNDSIGDTPILNFHDDGRKGFYHPDPLPPGLWVSIRDLVQLHYSLTPATQGQAIIRVLNFVMSFFLDLIV